jgi:hypothetical protein
MCLFATRRWEEEMKHSIGRRRSGIKRGEAVASGEVHM